MHAKQKEKTYEMKQKIIEILEDTKILKIWREYELINNIKLQMNDTKISESYTKHSLCGELNFCQFCGTKRFLAVKPTDSNLQTISRLH